MSEKTTELQKAFDANTLSGKLVELNVEQATQFIDFVVDESAMLKEVRLVKTEKPNKDFAQMFPKGRFLRPGKRGIALTAEEEQEMGSKDFTLTSKLLRGRISISDEDLKDNIEDGAMTDHFFRIIAKEIANEIEEVSIYAKESAIFPESDMFTYFEGFKAKLIKEGNVVDAADAMFTDRLVSRQKFVKAHKAIPTKYRRFVKNYLPADVYIDYTELFATGPLVNNRAEITDTILSRPIVTAPLMRTDEAVLVDGGVSGTIGAITIDSVKAGVNQIVATNASYEAGMDLVINHGTSEEQTVTIKTVGTVGSTTTPLTLTANLLLPCVNGSTLKEVTRDGADVIVTDPNNLLYMIQTTEMSFETFRDPSVGRVYFYKMRINFGIENPEAASILTNLLIK